jgi:KaiC/GvpD/RAD55 family RecA-like ATPase
MKSLREEWVNSNYHGKPVTILLRTFPKDGRLVRVFQVEKMRGLAIDNQPRPYDISAKGIEVYPSATVYK